MVLVNCPGCNKQYESGRSLRAHQRGPCGVAPNARLRKQQKKKAKISRQVDITDEALNGIRDDLREEVNSFEARDELEDTAHGRKRKLHEAPLAPEKERIFIRIRIPKKFLDELPPAPPYIPATRIEDEDDSRSAPGSDSSATASTGFRTARDGYGVLREYPCGKPSITPDHYHSISELSDSPYLALDPSQSLPISHSSASQSPSGTPVQTLVTKMANPFEPFRNASTYRLMDWFYRPSLTKSISELSALVRGVILAPDFNAEDLVGFDAVKEHARMDKYREPRTDDPTPFSYDDGWLKGSVDLPLPCAGFKYLTEAEAPKFKVEFHYRKITQVVQSALAQLHAEKFHTFPFKAYWQSSPDVPEERVYSEIYTGDFWNAEYQTIHQIPRSGEHTNLETFIVALLIWSDSTSLAQFGNAELWPIYLYLGNQSKYERAKPNYLSSHHLAYLPKIDDKIQEYYKAQFGEPAIAAVLKQLRRDLFHAVWAFLMDDEFIQAYVHGLISKLLDGIERLSFPRFFTYSMDYPEKVLMSCIKYLGLCACPDCALLKAKIHLLGSKSDMCARYRLLRTDSKDRRRKIEQARRLIFKGVTMTSQKIDQILGPGSEVPTRNAFSERLFEHGFDFHRLVVPDLLHEFELGVWKAVFTHLLRILYAYGNDTIQELNARYRQIPSFGRDTIRRFSTNASAMKKLGARDFEDLLQCAIPVFEGLLPNQHDGIVRKLLFELNTWHSLAKLRLHTETTINDLEHSTTRLGSILRNFQKNLCSAYSTVELPSEEAARVRRQASAAKKALQSQSTKKKQTLPSTMQKKKTSLTKGGAPSKSRRQRTFNLNTYKVHSLGSYARAIRLYGSTDNYNSQTGELEHRRAKRFYRRVRKGKHTIGIGLQVRREQLIQRIKERSQHKTAENNDLPSVPFEVAESLPPTAPTDHYHISLDTRNKVQLCQWLKKNGSDPALRNFLPRLKNHFLSRLLEHKYDGDELPFTASDRRTVIIENDILYRHKVLRINYTTYDLRRAQDSLNPRIPGHADVMVLSPENEEENEDPHPYWYARILGIYHSNIRHLGPNSKSPEPQKMHFLFVRWFGRDLDPRPGWNTKRLTRLGFVPESDGSAFGFLDPSQIIRAVHLIPAFKWGRVTTKYLSRSPIARGTEDPDSDWQLFYVGMFSDRDLIMRFRGGGVGHKSTRDATNFFKSDRDPLDLEPVLSGSEEEEPEMEDIQVGDEEMNSDEERDYGYDCSESESNSDTDDESREELDEEEFGPEGDGGGINEDMVALGYSEL